MLLIRFVGLVANGYIVVVYWSVIELQKNKCGDPLYPSFLQQHGPSGVVKISEWAQHTVTSM